MPPNALICTVLTDNWCCYWPKYFTPPTNLCCTLANIGPSSYRPVDPCTAGLWSHPQLTYNPSPTLGMLASYQDALIHLAPSDMHIFISYCLHSKSHFRLYFIQHDGKLLSQGCAKGNNQMQALCQAVKAALPIIFDLCPGHTFLWLGPSSLITTLLMLKPYRNTDTTYDICLLIAAYLTVSPTNTLTIRSHLRSWPGNPNPEERLTCSLEPLLVAELSCPTHPTDWDPKTHMWRCLHNNFIPSDNPSHVVCAPPISNSLPPTILVVADSGDRTICSIVIHLSYGHCFNVDYSHHFCKEEDDKCYVPLQLSPCAPYPDLLALATSSPAH